eukprot:TRINITY_DN2174_c0_g3_i1.p1 TRINITY_DN2174_c0_g3~~TRINITY_DN2174_c0_g3_i1.p1  ORF type:complete len:270 (+),score=107.95 TRINITY_DN2174_c0_g3_i1:65-874(+)
MNINKESCHVCEKAVYAQDRLAADGRIYHKACFRCKKCSGILKLGSYASMDSEVYCKNCFKKMFFTKGNYSEGFGKLKPQEQHELKTGTKNTMDRTNSFKGLDVMQREVREREASKIKGVNEDDETTPDSPKPKQKEATPDSPKPKPKEVTPDSPKPKLKEETPDSPKPKEAIPKEDSERIKKEQAERKKEEDDAKRAEEEKKKEARKLELQKIEESRKQQVEADQKTREEKKKADEEKLREAKKQELAKVEEERKEKAHQTAQEQQVR